MKLSAKGRCNRVAGLPGLPMRFGASRACLPINIQVVRAWYDDATVLPAAMLLGTRSSR